MKWLALLNVVVLITCATIATVEPSVSKWCLVAAGLNTFAVIVVLVTDHHVS